jgi:hypothetical protein
MPEKTMREVNENSCFTNCGQKWSRALHGYSIFYQKMQWEQRFSLHPIGSVRVQAFPQDPCCQQRKQKRQHCEQDSEYFPYHDDRILSVWGDTLIIPHCSAAEKCGGSLF